MTQMEYAKKGVFTKEMEIVSKDEHIEKDKLIKLISNGKVVIPCNVNHKNIYPRAIGKYMKTKINVNLGVSEDCCNYEEELEKANKAIEYGTDAIMDLSTFGDTKNFRKNLIANCTTMIGTVPMYDAVAKLEKILKI